MRVRPLCKLLSQSATRRAQSRSRCPQTFLVNFLNVSAMLYRKQIFHISSLLLLHFHDLFRWSRRSTCAKDHGPFESILPTKQQGQTFRLHRWNTTFKTQLLEFKTNLICARPSWFYSPFCLILYAAVIDGGWSLWSNWSSCSGICGKVGNKTRSRNCTNPAPENGGEECQGSEESVAQCSVPCT